MTLPDLALQIAYGKVAWALVLVAVLSAWIPGLARRHWRATAAGFVVLCALPGAWSPAWWLTLAFQYPSGLIVGLGMMALERRRQGTTPTMLLPPAMALPLALAGTALYLDTFGVLSLGLYHGGFGTIGAPVLGFLAIVACAFAVWRGHALQPAVALLTGLLLHALLRLPTGNLWDALLDPLLWMWALGSAIAAGVRHAAGARASAAQLQEASVQVPVAEPAPVGVAGIEQLQR